jgi:hypothetical protein
MIGSQRGWEVMALLLTGGLFKGLSRLATAPLMAVLIILGAMGLLMLPAASLCGATLRHAGLPKKPR